MFHLRAACVCDGKGSSVKCQTHDNFAWTDVVSPEQIHGDFDLSQVRVTIEVCTRPLVLCFGLLVQLIPQK
jgi:hypothetical protein